MAATVQDHSQCSASTDQIVTMFTFASDYRTILFILGLLPSVIVNLSTSYSKEKFNDEVALGRSIPGSEYQLESPLFDRHHEEEDLNNVILDDDERYQLVGASSLKSKRPGSEFVTRKNFSQSKLPADNQHWLNKLFSKGWKHKRVAFEQDLFPKKTPPVDDPFTKDADKMVPMASSNDDYRSGHYFDSYGDWHHYGGNGGGGGNGAGGSDLADHQGSHYHHPGSTVTSTTNGHGHSLAGLNLLNPLILVATLSFIISLINAVLGVVDKIRLPVVRAREGSSMGLSRLVDDGFFDELDDVLDGLHKTQKKGSQS